MKIAINILKTVIDIWMLFFLEAIILTIAKPGLEHISEFWDVTVVVLLFFLNFTYGVHRFLRRLARDRAATS